MPLQYMNGDLVTLVLRDGTNVDGVVVQPWGRRTVRVVYWDGTGCADSYPRFRALSHRRAPGPHDARLRREAEYLRGEYKRSLGRPGPVSKNAPSKGLPGHSGNRASFWRGRP